MLPASSTSTKSSSLAIPERCLLLKNSIQLWVSEAQAEVLLKLLSSKQSEYVTVQGQVFSSSEVNGIFTPDKMDEYTRRRNGQWQCKEREWHERGERCGCLAAKVKAKKDAEWEEYKQKHYAEHGYYPTRIEEAVENFRKIA